MNINWKVRIKNPTFWIGIVVSIFVPIFAYTGLSAQDITSWDTLFNLILNAVKNPYVLLMVAVSVYNAIVDPTSSGITDSANALTYTEPNSEKGDWL